MKKTLAVAFALAMPLVFASRLLAKGTTTRIVIEGADLVKPVEISEQGYVYLPGKSDEWWQLNVRSIVRGVEGKWFHAWSTWEGVARPLIEKAREANSRHPARN